MSVLINRYQLNITNNLPHYISITKNNQYLLSSNHNTTNQRLGYNPTLIQSKHNQSETRLKTYSHPITTHATRR